MHFMVVQMGEALPSALHEEGAAVAVIVPTLQGSWHSDIPPKQRRVPVGTLTT
jgi:hypothetical protein